MFQDKQRDKHGFLIETVKEAIKARAQGSQERPLFEQREWDPTIVDKLLWTPPKVDKTGFEIPDSEKIENLPTNAYRILVFDNRLRGRIGYDEARRSCVIREEIPYEIRRNVPWREIPALYDGKPWKLLGDTEETKISAFLQTHYRIKIHRQELKFQIEAACRDYSFHSIRDWLDTLEPQPGVCLSEDWLIRLCGVADTPLNRAYCVRILQAAVARAYSPGCKLDTMPVLYGKHGAGKSELWKALTGTLNNSSLHVVFREKIGTDNATRVTHSAWCVDLDECAALKRMKDQEIVKQWITTTEDVIVQKFKNETEKWPRSSFMVSSSNPSSFIRDPSGARRYWIIEVGTIDLRAIAAEREQLFAEAVQRYRAWEAEEKKLQLLIEKNAPVEDLEIAKEKAKELHWSLPPWLWKAQAESVEFCTTEISYEGRIERYLEESGKSRISTYEIIRDCLRVGATEQSGDAEAVAKVMHKLGWKNVRYREGGDKIRGWENPKA